MSKLKYIVNGKSAQENYDEQRIAIQEEYRRQRAEREQIKKIAGDIADETVKAVNNKKK